MPVNHVAENVFGTIGTILWTIQLVPQIWKSYRTKSTHGLSPALVFVWGLSGGALGIYTITQNLNIPLIVQPGLFSALCFVSWGQCLYYSRAKSRRHVIFLTLSVMLLVGIFEFIMVIALRLAYHRQWPPYSPSPFDSTPLGPDKPGVLFFGILSASMISLGLAPQYYEIYIHKEVIGISKLFMFVDILGGVFSILSLAFKTDFDIVASVNYSLVVALDGIVLILAAILNPRARKRRVREASQNASNGVQTSELRTVS